MFNPDIEEIVEKCELFVDDWAKYLGFYPQWEMVVKALPEKKFDSKEIVAHVVHFAGYKLAKIQLNTTRIMNREVIFCWCQVERIIVHELCHIFTFDLCDTIDAAISGQLNEQMTRNIETTTDSIANVFLFTRYGSLKSRFCDHTRNEEVNG